MPPGAQCSEEELFDHVEDRAQSASGLGQGHDLCVDPGKLFLQHRRGTALQPWSRSLRAGQQIVDQPGRYPRCEKGPDRPDCVDRVVVVATMPVPGLVAQGPQQTLLLVVPQRPRTGPGRTGQIPDPDVTHLSA